MAMSSCVQKISVSDEGVEVTFPSGKTYRYAEADKQTVVAVLSESSVGAGFNMHMRNMDGVEIA